MNWSQLYTMLTPEERDDLTIEMLKYVEARNQRILEERTKSLRLAKGKPRDERLELLGWAHFVGAHRGLSRVERTFVRSIFIYILTTVSVTVWLLAATVPLATGALIVLGYDVFLFAIMLLRPFQPKRWVLNISRS